MGTLFFTDFFQLSGKERRSKDSISPHLKDKPWGVWKFWVIQLISIQTNRKTQVSKQPG